MTIFMKNFFALLLFVSLYSILLPSFAHAESAENAKSPSPLFGLSMHGETKYDESSKHLEYANPNAPKGGALRMSATGSFDTLNPYALKGSAPQNMNLVYDRLMQRVWDEPFTMYPLIAKKISVPEDRSSITFTLNPKARFHDGSKITARDVVFSYKTLKESGRPNMRRVYALSNDPTVQKNENGEEEVAFTLKDGFNRETIMIIAMMPVLSEKWWQGKDFNQTTIQPPLGNGPYRVKDVQIGKKITYERVEDYWAKDLFFNVGHYNFDTITYDYYRDDTIALEAFKKGDLDLRREWNIGKWTSNYNDIPPNIVKSELEHGRPERAHGFIFNFRRPPFDNPAVRKALSLAFDEEWVGTNIYHNKFTRIRSIYPNSVLDASASEEPAEKQTLRKRQREASKLLKEQGWIIKDGKRINEKTGEPLAFELLLSTPQEEKIALTYQRSLERLGIDLSIRVADSATFQERKSAYDYDMLSFFWQNSLSPGTEQVLYWSCATKDRPSGFNFSGICNLALDEAAQNIAQAVTYSDLKQQAHKIDSIIMKENVFIPLFYKGRDYIAHKNTIKFTEINPIYGAVLETWWHNTPETE